MLVNVPINHFANAIILSICKSITRVVEFVFQDLCTCGQHLINTNVVVP